MASIEEDMLRDIYQVFRKIAAKYLRKRSPSMSQRMQQARAQQQPQLLEALREQEYRSLVEDLQNERRNNPEFANDLDRLPDDQRTQLIEQQARWQQDQRDRMDADPNLTPEDIQREVEQGRDLDGNGLDDREDREREAEDFERDVIDPNGNGEIDAVEQRQAAQAERDAEQAREREQERNEEARETEEARGGDALPAAAAAGATAVAAEEVAEELQEERREQELEDQQETEVLNDDGTSPEVIGETAAEASERQEQLVGDDAAAPEVIGETEAERDARLAEPEVSQDDRILDEDGAAPAVIGEDAQQVQQEQDDRILDEDGAAPAVIGEDAQEVQQEQDDRILDEDGAAPAVIGEDGPGQDGVDGPGQDDREPEVAERREEQVEEGVAGPQPGFKTGGDQVAASQEEQQNTEQRPDAVETTLQDAREQRQGGDTVDRSEQNGQRPGMSQDEIDRLKGLQGGQADAAEATRPRSGEPAEVGAGGKNPGARAAELRADKGSRRDGPGVGE
jgi:hypothetical protein